MQLNKFEASFGDKINKMLIQHIKDNNTNIKTLKRKEGKVISINFTHRDIIDKVKAQRKARKAIKACSRLMRIYFNKGIEY